MKKILIFLLIVAMSVSLTACSSNSPDKVVKGMLDAVKSWDMEGMKKYISADDFYAQADMDSESSATAEAMMKLFVANMSYKIIDTKVSGNTATVNVEITNVDMKPVFEDSFSQLIALAFSGVDLTDAQGEAKMLEIFTTSINNNKSTKVTNKVAVTLTKGQDGWTVDQLSDQFVDALLGGFISAAQDTSTMFDSEE